MPDPRPDHRRAHQQTSSTGSTPGSGVSTFQRVASWLLIAFIALTVIGFAGALMYSAFNETNPFFSGPIWQVAYLLPLVCLPLAAATLIAIVVSAARQKSQQRR